MVRKKSVAEVRPTPNRSTRYDRVKQILGASARESGPSGSRALARFWDQDLEHFKQASIYGVRLIAPEQPGFCCSDGNRSARSGLIKALRGEAPFDGRQYPPRPWGGAPVDDDDIQFIADWIDDDCPADDLGKMPLDAAQRDIIDAQVIDLAEFEIRNAGARRYAYRDGEPRQRANLDCLNEAELDELRGAFRAIYDLDKHEEDRRNFNNQALIHQNHCQHGWERFLPWHRAYVYEFEQNLHEGHHGPVLGLDHAAIQTAPPDQWLDHSQGVPGLPQAGRARRDVQGAAAEAGAGEGLSRHDRAADVFRLAARVLLSRE